jgi:serine/threonine protein kinase
MHDRIAAALSDRYAVERELGRGGMATVWLARDSRHDRLVAIKVLLPELAGAIGADRFIREVRLTAGLQHPSIVSVLDSGVLPADGDVPLPWYAMAYVAGESLRTRLARDGQLPIDEAVAIARDVAAALAAAHAQGIVHRDIKPENILLGDGRVYIVDVGIAKALLAMGEDRLTSTGLALGTPAYMSPEQATGAPVDARTDQYSLAAVLYEMLAGEPPVTGPNAQAILARRLAEPVRPIRPARPTVSEELERVILRALERVPADRFADVTAFSSAVGRAAASVASPRTCHAPAPPATARRRGRGGHRPGGVVGRHARHRIGENDA